MDPVVSIKSGHVFERSVVTAHVEMAGTCPITGEPLTVDDLLAVKTTVEAADGTRTDAPATVAPPRTAAAASIPSMLVQFQNEWDAVMLECFTLRQNMEKVRQELAHALYENEAACRVIARLVKERDAARAALADAGGSVAPAATGGDEGEAMDGVEATSGGGLAGSVLDKIKALALTLAEARGPKMKAAKNAVPEYADYSVTSSHTLHKTTNPGVNSVAINPKDVNVVATGGLDHNVVLFNHKSGKVVQTLNGHSKKVTQVAFLPAGDAVVSASADKTVRVWEKKGAKFAAKHTVRTHKDVVSGVAVHASGDYVASSSHDGTVAFSDVRSGETLWQSPAADAGYGAVAFHPDGLLLGAGTLDNKIHIYDMRSQAIAVTFDLSAPVSRLAYAENGTVFASASTDGAVKLFDLRKVTELRTLTSTAAETGAVSALAFDAQAQSIAFGNAAGVVNVFSVKKGALLATYEDHQGPVSDLAFSHDSAILATVGAADRALKVYQAQ